MAGTLLDTRSPDEAVRDLARDARTAVVALTHDPRLDDLALLEALVSPAFYVGALGSHPNSRPPPRAPAPGSTCRRRRWRACARRSVWRSAAAPRPRSRSRSSPSITAVRHGVELRAATDSAAIAESSAMAAEPGCTLPRLVRSP
ncbi:MAG: XdhC family protein [Chromatiales bacterium]|nr:XdhC family protein [Chromatiales bacterium]